MLKKCMTIFSALTLLFLFQNVAQACTLTYGTYQPNSAELKKTWLQSKLNHALANASHCSIELKTFSDQNDLRKAVLNHEVDIAFLKSFNFYLAQKKNPEIKPLAITLTYDPYAPQKTKNSISVTHNGYVISLANKNIHSFNDLAGKSIGFLGSPQSTSEFISPIMFLADQNKDYKTFFAKTNFFSDEKELVEALKSGKVDAITTWNLSGFRKNSKDIKIVKVFHNLPNPVVVAVNPEKMEFNTLQKALVTIPIEKNSNTLIRGFAMPDKFNYSELFKTFEKYCTVNPTACE